MRSGDISRHPQHFRFASTSGAKEDVAGYVKTMFELLPKLAGLNQKDRRRYASLAREWAEEAELQTRARTSPQQMPTL